MITPIGHRRRNRLRLNQPSRGPGSESAGYHYGATPKNPAPTKTPIVAAPPNERAVAPAGHYAGAQTEFNRAVGTYPLGTVQVAPLVNPTPSLTAQGLLASLPELGTPPAATGLTPFQEALEKLGGVAAHPGSSLIKGFSDAITPAKTASPTFPVAQHHQGDGLAVGAPAALVRDFRHAYHQSDQTATPKQKAEVAAAKVYAERHPELQQTPEGITPNNPRYEAVAAIMNQQAPASSVAGVQNLLNRVRGRGPTTPNPLDPLGPKTVGNATQAELQRFGAEGRLGLTRKGKLLTPPVRHSLLDLHKARAAVRNSRTLPTVRPGGGQHSEAEWATIIKEEGDKLGLHLTPQEIADGVGTIWAESGGTTDNTAQIAKIGPSAAHIGAWAEEEPGFGTEQERLDPRASTRLALENFAANGRSFDPGWWHWQQIQGENETGQERAAQYLPIAQQVAQGGTGSPQAIKALQAAKAQVRAHGINPTPFNGDVTGGGAEYTTVRADAKGMVQWLNSALGVQEGSPQQQHWASKLGLGSSEPWCANLVSNGLLRRGFSPDELPENPNNTGTPGFEQWGQEGKYATVVKGGLADAKPGDILTFSGAHTATYIGNGEMISGNFSNEVEKTPVSAGPAPLSMVIRPHYKGGNVKVKDSQITGSDAESALGATGGGTPGGSSEGGAGVATNQALPEAIPLQLPSFAATPVFSEIAPPDLEGSSELLRLLTEPRL